MKFKPFKAFKVLFNIETAQEKYPADFEKFHIDIIEKVKPYTMTSIQRLYTLIESVKYIINSKIEGDIIECGVWKGGSMMAIAETLLRLNIRDRNLFLFDTFDGMTNPSEFDRNVNGISANSLLKNDENKKEESVIWAYSTIEEVKKNMSKINYPSERIHFVKGDVLETLPSNIYNDISLMRLDTDWYESTKHELIHLYPRLKSNGILIIDDYGCWQGSKRAVDEYFKSSNITKLLSRIDETGRIMIK